MTKDVHRQDDLGPGDDDRAGTASGEDASDTADAAEAIRRTRERVEGARDDVERIAERARALHEQTQRLRERIRRRRSDDLAQG